MDQNLQHQFGASARPGWSRDQGSGEAAMLRVCRGSGRKDGGELLPAE